MITFWIYVLVFWVIVWAGIAWFWRREAHKMRDKWHQALEQVSATEKARETAINSLKTIALGKGDAFTTADRALRDLGLHPWVVDANVPSDRIYFMPKGMSPRPTDYF